MFRFIKKFSNLVLIFVAALCVFSVTQISAADNTKTYDFDTLTSIDGVSKLFGDNVNVNHSKVEYFKGQIKLGSKSASGYIEIDYGENGINCSSVNVVVSSYSGSAIVKLTVNDTISGEITLTGSDNKTLSVDVNDIVSKIKIETMAKPNQRAYLHQLNLVQAPLTKMYDVNFIENAPSLSSVVENMPMSVQVEEGALLAAPTTNPTVVGYVFNGWFTDSACTNQYDFNSEVVANLDLYASWTKDESKVTVIFDGTDTVVSVDINTACSKENAPAGPVVAGKVFKYWSESNSADATEFDWTQTLASTTTLYPVYRDMTANELAGEAFAALSTKAQLKVNYKNDRVDTSLTATLNYASGSLLVGENLPGSTLGLDENFVFTTTKGSGDVACNSNSTQIRIYQISGSNVGSLTITATSKDIQIKNGTTAVKDNQENDCTEYGKTSDGFAYVKFYSIGEANPGNRIYINNGTVLFEYVAKKEKIKDTHTSLCFGSNEITQEMYNAASEFGVLYTTTAGVDFASITDIAALPEGVSSKAMTFVPQGDHYQARACFTFNQDGVDCCEQYATEIHACVYAIIGGKLYMMGDQTFSVNSLAKNYVDKHGDNASVQKHHGMLEALKTMHGQKQN